VKGGQKTHRVCAREGIGAGKSKTLLNGVRNFLRGEGAGIIKT